MKRSVLDYLENTAKRCPERLAWDASAPFTFGQWWDAAQRIASSLSSRCALKTKLARYMLPDEIVLLPELPHTANMKIDRQTLRKRMTEQG